MNIQENLKREMSRQQIKEPELAARSGLHQSTINRIKKGEIKNPGLDKIILLAKGLSITVDQLLDDEIGEQQASYEVKTIKKYYPRVVGTARCGDQGFYMDLEGGGGFIEMESRTGSIAIRIKGHSMHPAIKEDWFVVIEPDKSPVIGEYVLVKFLDGRKMVKELLQKKSDGYLLLSVNSNERITANHEEIEGIEAITAIVPPSKHKDF